MKEKYNANALNNAKMNRNIVQKPRGSMQMAPGHTRHAWPGHLAQIAKRILTNALLPRAKTAASASILPRTAEFLWACTRALVRRGGRAILVIRMSMNATLVRRITPLVSPHKRAQTRQRQQVVLEYSITRAMALFSVRHYKTRTTPTHLPANVTPLHIIFVN